MKTSLVEIKTSSSGVVRGLKRDLNFRKFVKHIQERLQTEHSARKEFFEYVLQKLTEDPAFLQNIDPTDTDRFSNQLGLIYHMMVAPESDENEVYWALSTPMDPAVFYGTNAFYRQLTDPLTGAPNCSLIQEEELNTSLGEKIKVFYSFILNNLYGYNLSVQNTMVVNLPDVETQLPRYYRINIDTRFIEVSTDFPLPELDPQEFVSSESTDWNRLAELLPLDRIRFEGFSIITLHDVTAEHTVELIKDFLLHPARDHAGFQFAKISEYLQTLIGNHAIQFGILPILRLNNRIVFNHQSYSHSMVMKQAMDKGMPETEFRKMAEDYFAAPKTLILNGLKAVKEPADRFTELLIVNEIKSYALLPVYHNRAVGGVLEVYSKEPIEFSNQLLARLDVALPLVGQILQNSIDEFNTSIDTVIRDKFTSIQPSVQWKFREVAWQHVKKTTFQQPNGNIDNVQFKNVYPLYGAIDIRNSTIERNKALQDDLLIQFEALQETIRVIRTEVNLHILDELIYKCQKWIARIEDHSSDHEELKIKDFFDYEVDPVLNHFRANFPQVSAALANYDDVTNEETGAAYENRRALESSMQKINSALNLYLDLFKNQIQESYPSYFEKFRTDGVEYDIYIGQSIAPDKPFNTLYLRNIRLWQLTSMAAIGKITNALIASMEKPLETTQLIFIHPGGIDISFRDDERRFDVEGAYNIRYHIIKKRIDKVHIAGTNERLTQPGKIAMVYFNAKEAEEYVEYIRYLQEQGLLSDDLEILELEELQGVTGLRALRVGIKLDKVWNQMTEIAKFEPQATI